MILACMLGGISFSRAQFAIMPIQPPSNFVYEDLWHLTVNGNDSSYNEFYISLRIYNEQSVLEVKSESSVFGINYLPLYVNKNNLGPLPSFSTLYYNSTLLQSVVQSGGFFPVGVYNIQFLLFGRPSDGQFTELAEYTYQQVVEAFWPPMLLTPYDEDTIETPYPLLTWTPAYFAANGQQILYTLNMVELNANQNPYMGITSNPSHFTQADLPGTVLPYPSSAMPIELGKRYAWQVAATVNSQPVVYSQVWSFVYWVDTLVDTNTIVNKMYFHPKRIEENKGIEYLISVEDFVRFQFDQEYAPDGSSQLRFLIQDSENATVYDSDNTGLYPVAYGLNRYALDPCLLSLDKNEPWYRLLLYNDKNQGFFLYFKLSPDLNCN